MTRTWRIAIFFYGVLTLSGWAKEEVLFYSQSTIAAQEQLQYYQEVPSPTRPFIPLLGIYDLFDSHTLKKVGQVTVPTIYYETHPFVFRKSFQLSDTTAYNYVLHFGQLNGDARIALNNRLLYQGSRNFMPVQISLPVGLLKPGENLLEIQITPWRGQEGQLPLWIPINLPKIYSGINGPVFLQAIPRPGITQLSASWEVRGSETQISGEIFIRKPPISSGNLELNIRLLENAVVICDSIISIRPDSLNHPQTLPFQIKSSQINPWSINKPQQHFLQVILWQDQTILDQLSRRLAIRRVAVKNKKFMLNDSLLTLKGINYQYQDLQGIGLPDRQLILNDLQIIRSRGYNLIRLGYYPQSSLFYQLSDSLGILCLQDLPYPLLLEQMVRDTLSYRSLLEYVQSFIQIAEQHPSLIGVGLGNLYFDPDLEDYREQQKKLRTFLSGNTHFLSYISSFDWRVFPNDLADFYCLEILERNNPNVVIRDLELITSMDYPVLISGLSKPISYRVDSLQVRQEVRQNAELLRSIGQAPWRNNLLGETLFTYADYLLQTPSLSAGSADQKNFILNSSGLYTLDRRMKKEADIVFKQKWLLLNNRAERKISEENQTYFFIVFGLINLFIFLFLFRSLVDFRKNIFRAIRKPHGFFVELLERRMISFEQSFYLMFFISLNGAVMLAGILYFFRNNLLADYLLSIPMAFSSLKLIAARIIWKPLWMVPIFTLVIMFFFVLLTVPIQLLSLIRGTKIRNRQALATSAWSAAPFLLLLPFGMFFYNLLLVINSHWILFAVLLYFHFWYYIRWLNGTRVMCLWSYPAVFLYSLLLMVVFGGGLVIYLQQKIDVPLHLNLLTQLLQYHFK